MTVDDVDVREIHLSGCAFGRILEQKVKDTVDRIGSKIEDAQTCGDVSVQLTRELKEELTEVKMMALEATSCADETKGALNDVVNDLKEDFKEAKMAFGEVAHELKTDFKCLGKKWDGIWIPIIINSMAVAVTLLSGVFVLLKYFAR